VAKTNIAPASVSAPAVQPTHALLKTKILTPALRGKLIERPQLLARLDAGYPVSLVTAPAGSGKTTLLSQWAARRLQPVVWLSLDELDNDLPRFLTYLIAAVNGTDALSASQEITVTAAINMLAAVPLTLILDNYQVISNAAIHDTMMFIINHLPPHARLIIAGRSHPPLPLARLRSARQLEQINDLNFTMAEAAELLGLAPHDPNAHLLTERTRGWLAGLQLAALWCEKSDDPHAFGGSYRYLYDYFMEEVATPQPAGLRHFLLNTSVLDPLFAEICDALTEHNDSQTLLERLEQLNLFITPLDDVRRAYRYHPLFAEFLQEWLRRQQGDLMELYRKASHWYEQHGVTDKAIDHAFAAHDWERAAGMIAQVAQSGVDVTQWLNLLPEEMRISQPKLAEPLSEREAEVLELISKGKSNPEIASILIIAVSTVKTHVKSIYRKLDVDSRYEAMQRARARDLLSIRMETEFRRLIK
jgi:LuxR family maltose regulon positive regulatory protein